MTFLERVRQLARLGVGVSTEYGASSHGGLSPLALHEAYPHYAQFLELGIEIEKGLDADALAWVARGLPTTYHFLDINLDEPEDFDEGWQQRVVDLVQSCRPQWLCGDAGLWHFGTRDRGQMLLLPPVLIDEQVETMAPGIAQLRELTGREVLPENPPGTAFVGDLHLLDFFAKLCDKADTGMLLDVAHLAVYQRAMGHAALTGCDGFDWDRVVEIHVAGGVVRNIDDFEWIEDTHGIDVLPETWEIFDYVVSRARNLKAVLFECERNSQEQVLAGFEKITRTWQQAEQT